VSLPENSTQPTSTEGRSGRRRTARVAATLAAGAALGAAAFAGVQGIDGSGQSASTATPPATTAAVTSVAAQAAQYDAAALYKRASPGVVDLTVTLSGSGNGVSPFAPGGGGQAEGTGFVYDKSGNIVTAAHVVEDATAITVNFKDGTTAKATLVGTDPSSDTAVVKINVPAAKLTPLALADSSAVQPGQGVVAIGSPFGYEDSITAGIVSGVGRSIEAPNGYSISNAIQTDAAINHGNSGGPLIDESGKVIGINVQIAASGSSGSSQNAGVGFAVPSNTVKSVVTDLIAGKTVQHAYLGVSVGDNAAGAGATVGTVRTGSPAARAGLKVGDVVTAIDGGAVTDAAQLTARVSAQKPGDKVTLTVQRSGSTLKLDVTLGTRPATTA
jgi:putative serine protease PepD